MDYHDLIGEHVKIVDKDGDVFVGPIISYEVGTMEDLDYDSIGVQIGEDHYIGIPIPDIVSCEILEV